MSTQMKNLSASLRVDSVSLDDLKLDPANPRRIAQAELEALTRSISEFGLVDPIIARAEDKTVIAGHQRLLAARKLGLKTVPVIFLDISPEKARLLNVALNKISGDFDQELLARLLADLSETPQLDLTLSGFDDKEIKQLIRHLEAREKRERPEAFDLDAALRSAYENPRATRGDLFKLGDHRVLCGDATSSEDVTRVMDGGKANLAICDPPYAVGYGDHGGQQQGQRRRRIMNDALAGDAWEEFCRKFVRNIIAVSTGAIYLFMSSKELPLLSRVLEEGGAHWSDTLIWRKNTFTLGRAPYQHGYEPLWFGWPQGVKPYWCGDRDQSYVWEFDRPTDAPLHPTMKPTSLLERAIENSSRPGDVVLDLFLGSGSTLIAAERTGRICYGLELDEHYASLAIARWEAFTGEKAERIGHRSANEKGPTRPTLQPSRKEAT